MEIKMTSRGELRYRKNLNGFVLATVVFLQLYTQWSSTDFSIVWLHFAPLLRSICHLDIKWLYAKPDKQILATVCPVLILNKSFSAPGSTDRMQPWDRGHGIHTEHLSDTAGG